MVPSCPSGPVGHTGAVTATTTGGVRARAGAALRSPDLDEKVDRTRALADDLAADPGDGTGSLLPAEADGTIAVVAVTDRGRPGRPVLVPPRQLRSRRLTTTEGRVAALHAVTHIEANAIDLALDAVHRFAGDPTLPDAFARDWVRVAAEEATHFVLLRDRLRDLGADYGDLPAHGGLWAMAERTADDPLRRMALVPRVLEARGLDVSPGMIDRFAAVGDEASAAALRVILRDEVGHVAVGSRWFAHLCAVRGLDPEPTFAALLAEEGVRVVPPCNVEARLRAGFTADELERLTTPTPTPTPTP